MIPRHFVLLIVLLSSISPFSLAQTNSAEERRAIQLLKDMSAALRQRDYRGLFTYEHGGALKTVRITHQVADGVEYEVLEHLNGPPLRVERSGVSTECLTPAEQVIRGTIPALDSGHSSLDYYRIAVRGEDRVAGRIATVVQVVPKDRFRYGYSISIDQETALPLSSMIINGRDRALERLQFSILELVPTDDWIEMVEEETRVKRLRWPLCNNLEDSGPFDWNVSWVPDGFVGAGSGVIRDVGEVMLYTDGLAAFSVFVRPKSDNVGAQGRAQRGATVAYMRQVEFNGTAYTITVVGEIPARTAQRVAASVFVPAPAILPGDHKREESSSAVFTPVDNSGDINVDQR